MRTGSSHTQIDRLCGTQTSYDDFYRGYLLPNRPCILSSGLVQQWNAFERFKKNSVGGQERDGRSGEPFAKLAELYGDEVAPVVVSDASGVGGGGEEGDRKEMSISEAVHLMQIQEGGGQGERKVYIKDWHIARNGTRTVQEPLYETPHLFADDWMNNRPSEEDDDFRFCYAGTAGTQTKLHRDDTSYSWSTNVVGRKRWRLFPPAVKRYLRRFPDVSSSEMAPSVDEMLHLQQTKQLGHVKEGKAGWPEWEGALKACIEIEQERKYLHGRSTLLDLLRDQNEIDTAEGSRRCACLHPEEKLLTPPVTPLLYQEGETIFIPSDWYHEVLNLTDCISINHNWCNACNILSMYRSMCEEVARTEDALDDVKMIMREQPSNSNDRWQFEWTRTVQQILVSNVGWGWLGFWKMVEHNLRRPPCPPHLSPSPAYVTEQLLPCLDNFGARQDFDYLGEETQSAWRASRLLLQKDEQK